MVSQGNKVRKKDSWENVTADQIMTMLYSAEGMTTSPTRDWIAVADHGSGSETKSRDPNLQQYVQEQYQTQTQAHKRKVQEESSESVMLAMPIVLDNSKKRIRVERHVSNADQRLYLENKRNQNA
jgi:hypothetical protein